MFTRRHGNKISCNTYLNFYFYNYFARVTDEKHVSPTSRSQKRSNQKQREMKRDITRKSLLLLLCRRKIMFLRPRSFVNKCHFHACLCIRSVFHRLVFSTFFVICQPFLLLSGTWWWLKRYIMSCTYSGFRYFSLEIT